ncbi:MAG: FGGY-family carbohydrate kinase, partial [Opitutales bacterium]|nr:FGGY-family carbohydrate kinase [Opitutales bacterium]
QRGQMLITLAQQFQADLMQVPVVRPQVTETTALGAAYLAGLSTGFWKDVTEMASHWKTDRIFEPKISVDAAAAQQSRWKKALERSKDWATN